MDTDGNRLLAKYYDDAKFPTPKSQAAFEALLISRTAGPNLSNEVAMLDGYVAVYRANLDVIVYVVGTAAQNELMLMTALDTYFDVLSEVLKPQMDKKSFFDNFEQAVLGLDEVIDRGIILETDAKEVTAKLARQPAASKAFQSFVEKPLREQTLSSAFKMAKESWKGFF